ncbi:MAG: cyclase family protein, partial [Acidobacteriota bacterium]|nr:cyclase family protein [Acidobacteriota bacterium]
YAGLLFVMAGLVCLGAEDPSHLTSKADIERWMTELSNWNRWGKTDQVGAYNLITPGKRKEAAGLVKDGYSVSLSHDALTEKAADNPDPFIHKMNFTGAHPNGDWFMDEYTVNFHGLAHTHMDALAHTAWKGKMYNGFPQLDVTEQGAKELGITGFRNGIFTRAVLVDIPRLKGLPYLEPGVAIYPEDLEAWEKKSGVKIGSGDVVLIRTGRWARRAAKGPWDTSRVAGLHASCVPWLRKRDIALAGSDACLDVLPSQVEGVVQPVHQLLLIAMGTPILDNLDLEAAADEASKRNRWAFLITASPLTVKGGTGSPLNPIATF